MIYRGKRSKTLNEVKGQVKNSIFRFFDFDTIIKMKNSEEKNLEKNSEVSDVSEFLIYHCVDLLIKCTSLSVSSERFTFYKVRVIFCFLFLLCLNFLFQAIVAWDYPAWKYTFRVKRIKRYVNHICSKFKKLTKLCFG